jgi:hypothetical protein
MNGFKINGILPTGMVIACYFARILVSEVDCVGIMFSPPTVDA